MSSRSVWSRVCWAELMVSSRNTETSTLSVARSMMSAVCFWASMATPPRNRAMNTVETVAKVTRPLRRRLCRVSLKK